MLLVISWSSRTKFSLSLYTGTIMETSIVSGLVGLIVFIVDVYIKIHATFWGEAFTASCPQAPMMSVARFCLINTVWFFDRRYS